MSPTEPAVHITVKFDTRIYDDPNNWYVKDFIVFGNSFFAAGGSYVYSDSNMANVVMAAYEGSGWWEPSPVSVSQDGVTWYSFSNGPYADDYAPTQALAWDWVGQRRHKTVLDDCFGRSGLLGILDAPPENRKKFGCWKI